MQSKFQTQFDRLKATEFNSDNNSQYIDAVTELIALLQENYQNELSINYFDYINQLFQDADEVSATLAKLGNDTDVSTEAVFDTPGTLYKFVQNGTKNPLSSNDLAQISIHHNLTVLPVDAVDREVAFNLLNDMIEQNAF